MDLDVNVKATMLGLVFMIVSARVLSNNVVMRLNPGV